MWKFHSAPAAIATNYRSSGVNPVFLARTFRNTSEKSFVNTLSAYALAPAVQEQYGSKLIATGAMNS